MIPSFPDWFKQEYKRWTDSQSGEEDFLAFCSLLGYPAVTVLGWLQGDSLPEGAEILSIAGVLGMDIYPVLGKPEPDPELLDIYYSFTHLTGEYRSRLTYALWEAQSEMIQQGLIAKSEKAKSVLSKTFAKWGFRTSENQG